jgi:hypothetical protein
VPRLLPLLARDGCVEAEDGDYSEQGRAAVGSSGNVVVVGPVEDRGSPLDPSGSRGFRVDVIFPFPSPTAGFLSSIVQRGGRMALAIQDSSAGGLTACCVAVDVDRASVPVPSSCSRRLAAWC